MTHVNGGLALLDGLHGWPRDPYPGTEERLRLTPSDAQVAESRPDLRERKGDFFNGNHESH